MIKIYTSNNFNYLIKKICQIIYKKKTNNIFMKEILVTEDLEKSEIIKKKIAKILGISINLNFFTQNNFISYVLKKFLFKKKYLLLKKNNIFWELIHLSKYIKKICKIKKNEIENFQYLKELSKIFYEYLIFRPNWIIRWEYNKQDKKKYNKKYFIQKKIWKKIQTHTIKKNIYHYINLYKDFFKKKIFKKYIYKKFPSKIFIINPFQFSKFYFKILKKISKKIDIHIFISTPFDIRYLKKNKSWEKYSLLSIWTKNHIKQIKYIFSLSKKIEFFYEKKKNTLLNKIKNNFLKLIDKTNTKKIQIQSIDNSITIHECNNRLREIEILYENILQNLHENHKLQPKDIIVKTEKIKDYIPYIKSVFQSQINNTQIPYKIKKPLFTKNSILYILNKILSLPQNKFENEKILDFLNFKFIAKKFLISKTDIKIIKTWIKDTNIRWGIDKKHKKKSGIYPTFQNTWKYGIKKIILGYGIQENIQTKNKIRPYNIYEKDHINLLEKLIFFIKKLTKWKKKLSKKRKIKKWIKIYKKIIKDFFQLNKKNKKIYKIIKKKLIILLKEIKKSSYKKKMSVNILKYELNIRLKKIFIQKNINNNCIQFTNFNSLRKINSKITYCLGMNENNFPKKITENEENLIYKYQKSSDQKKTEDNFFLFFELLAFTEKKIYISYINNSPNKIEKNEISSVIKKLKKYIENNFSSHKNIFQKISFIHPKTNFEKKNIYNHTFKKTLFLKKIDLKKKFIKKIYLFKKIRKINFNKLISFWNNPINYFFNKILNIYYKNNNFINYNEEPFSIDYKNNYFIKKKILEYMLEKKDLKKLFNKIQSIGILPHKHFGKIHFKNQISKIKKIFIKIKNNKNLLGKKFLFKIKKFTIYGKLKNISHKELFRWKTSSIHSYNIISFWLEHLIHCLLKGEKSTYIGINKTISFQKISCKNSKKNLLKYILGYLQGLKKPIVLTKTGLNWFNYIFDKKEKKISIKKQKIKYSEKKFLETWNGNQYFLGEKKNLYLQKIFPKLNKKMIHQIKRTTKYWMLPIYKNIL
ncbi:exodeoxyribonuclease V subunit gamma [Buchnera aphidicola]|uniref:exodeoxyribonuclease V subunit gamma n=1 Tax=Buchnera aphidicola TaxID=9 RepID=UPI003464B63B